MMRLLFLILLSISVLFIFGCDTELERKKIEAEHMMAQAELERERAELEREKHRTMDKEMELQRLNQLITASDRIWNSQENRITQAYLPFIFIIVALFLILILVLFLVIFRRRNDNVRVITQDERVIQNQQTRILEHNKPNTKSFLLEHSLKQGKIKCYNEEKGFGFIQPEDGGDDVFFHISVVSYKYNNALSPQKWQTVQFTDKDSIKNKGKKEATKCVLE